MDALQKVAQCLANARAGVAFTGAGISTESGIPDFRSPGGVWETSTPVYFDQFLSSADARQEYWRQKAASHQGFATAVPNAAHRCLAKWQQSERLLGVVTQNIDGLHQDAGCRDVLELHGTARFVACLSCQARFEAGEMVQRFLENNQPPNCDRCGGLTKHATISFGQTLDQAVLQAATRRSADADLFLAIGSSLVVQPAAGLPALAAQSGARLVIVNRDPTPLDELADQVIRAPIGETLSAIDQMIR